MITGIVILFILERVARYFGYESKIILWMKQKFSKPTPIQIKPKLLAEKLRPLMTPEKLKTQ